MKKLVSSSEKVKSKISLILSRILGLILTISFFSGVAGHECPTRTLFGC